MKEPSLSIGEVAARVGLRASALRYYEEAGVLPPAERVGGKRRYPPEVVGLLLLVRFCQRLGFSLAEVRELVGETKASEPKVRWRRLVDAKIAEVDGLIEKAKAVRRVLEESRECQCVSLESCSLLNADEPSLAGSAARFSRTP